jgi:hypothetical protein
MHCTAQTLPNAFKSSIRRKNVAVHHFHQDSKTVQKRKSDPLNTEARRYYWPCAFCVSIQLWHTSAKNMSLRRGYEVSEHRRSNSGVTSRTQPGGSSRNGEASLEGGVEENDSNEGKSGGANPPQSWTRKFVPMRLRLVLRDISSSQEYANWIAMKIDRWSLRFLFVTYLVTTILIFTL